MTQANRRFDKAQRHPSPALPPNFIGGEGEKRRWVCEGHRLFRVLSMITNFKGWKQPNASGLLAPQTKCGERIKERGDRISSHANVHQTFVP